MAFTIVKQVIKMKVLLVYPHTPTFYGLPNYPPLGLSYLAGTLKHENIDYDVIDLRVYEDWKSVFLAELQKKYDLVGMGCSAYDYNPVRDLAQLIKIELPQSKIFLGGPYPTLVKDKILREDRNFDFLIAGEGELTLKELLEALQGKRSLGSVNGLIFRNGSEIKVNPPREYNEDLDSLPFPDYSKYDLKKYHGDTSLKGILKRTRIFPMTTSRGCPYSCTFCSIPVFVGKKFRIRNPESVINEIKYLKKEYRAGMIDILDDNMTLYLDRAKEICKLMIKEKLNISWGTPNGVRADKVDEELAELMHKSGCNGVAVGIESVDNAVLKNIKKAETIETITKGIQVLKKHKVPVKGFFLIGSPGGSKEEILKALEYSKENNLDEARFSMATPYPGTELYDWVSANNAWKVENPEEDVVKFTHGGDVKALYGTDSFSAEDMEAVYKEASAGWEEYDLQRNFQKRFKKKLQEYPKLRLALKAVRDKVKA